MPNVHSFVSHGMNLKRIATISYILNITGLTVSMHKITNGIKILTSHDSWLISVL